jgi:sulfatase modifying factor 1
MKNFGTNLSLRTVTRVCAKQWRGNLYSYILNLKLSIILITTLSMLMYHSQGVTYDTVIVGNPSNANDTTGFGEVSYIYQIGKYEVTIGQYAEFLNAVAASDPYSLWNTGMTIPNIQGIARSGTSGNYSYTVLNASNSAASSANMPISGVSWFNAARFANWMANGQPQTGVEDNTTTEDGAYPLNGRQSGMAIAKNTINPNTNSVPSYYIPTENEWYKAAFYNGNSYYVFATQSNVVPGNIIGSQANSANYLSDSTTGYSVSQLQLFSSTQTYITNVGTFSGSGSYYGTFDQTGNVWEWTDLTGTTSLSRSLRGGAWTSTPPYIQSSYRLITVATTSSLNLGFRLARPI